jgi:hypothetical protein
MFLQICYKNSNQNHGRKGMKTLLILLNPSMGSILFTSFKQVSETNLRLREQKYVVIIWYNTTEKKNMLID